jgi:hypothetical protein
MLADAGAVHVQSYQGNQAISGGQPEADTSCNRVAIFFSSRVGKITTPLQRMVQKSSMTNNNCHALITLVYRRACSNPTKDGQFLVRELTLKRLGTDSTTW